MNPSDYYFDIELGSEFIDTDDNGKSVITLSEATFLVVPKAHYDTTGYLDDGVGHIVNTTLFPLGFHESAEAMYKYSGSMEEGKQKLIALGFTQKALGFDADY